MPYPFYVGDSFAVYALVWNYLENAIEMSEQVRGIKEYKNKDR